MTLLPPTADDWVALCDHSLDVGVASEWVALPGCGAVVVFSGLVRDFADGSTGVTHIDYEAWAEQVLPRLSAVAEQARQRWPEIGRIVLWHREGRVVLSESSVVVAVSAPHRGAAFDACEFAIDTLKASVPIWKKEFFADGSQWARGSQHIVEATDAGILA
ncbi:MAG: molybdenum cofactor biosynthesis protein MoaE [Acidimicrobiales bacterium]